MKRRLGAEFWARLGQLTGETLDHGETTHLIGDLQREYESSAGDPVALAFQAGRRVGHTEGYRAGRAAGESETIFGIIDHCVKTAMTQATPDAPQVEIPPDQLLAHLKRLLEQHVNEEIKSLEGRLADGNTIAN